MSSIEKINPSKDSCILDLFLEQVQAQPNSTAVIYNNHTLSYQELAESSLNVARYLQSLGVTPDDCVGIFVEPSMELMIGAWGILLSGGAYLPLSPEYPEARLKYMIENSATRIIFTQAGLKEQLSELTLQDIEIVTLEDVIKFKELTAKVHHLEFSTKLLPSHLAYIIYTSGSTGKPKGVMIEHRSIVNQMNWLKKAFNLNNESIILQKTPMSFDAAQWEILALSCGSQVVIGEAGIYKNPAKLIETILKYNVTVLQCVPTLLQALLDTEEFYKCNMLTHLFSGGEALPKNLVLNCIESLPKCKIINLYGPTECTINTSAFVIDPDKMKDVSNTVSIGSPIDNIQYHILDDKQAPVALGEIGELYISGIGLARGYLHQPELTAEKFITHQLYPDEEQIKLYKTGDLAYWNSDGTVQYAGRVDDQVKLRGFRIELNEIKSAIDTHDWVKHSAVILKNDPFTGYQNLIAFIELNPKEAALMDQGNHDPHHQSKESKTQVMMQLANAGCREKDELSEKFVVNLPGREPTEKQKNLVFARKTYRYFEGQDINKANLLQILKDESTTHNFTNLEDLNYFDLGALLRYFGQYLSEERLLPKYGYASPGALYATQMYLELSGIGELSPGYYYYHPVYHQLILIKRKKNFNKIELKIHFIGKKKAIEPIYKNNIQEVLEIETGHMVGLFEVLLAEYGLKIEDSLYTPEIKNLLEVAEEDYYLGTFQMVSGKDKQMADLVDLYIQIHPGKINNLKAGLYKYNGENLEKISDDIILKKHVIAINQEVYNRASFGIVVISKTDKDWMKYINLGRKLQKLQMNNMNIGFMSSGYSSKTGYDLPSAKRMQDILSKDIGPSYFFLGGSISDEQKHSRGMKEDTVHMKGPAEMIKEDLINFLPNYMVPNKIIVLNKMPLTVNGKIDFSELKRKDVELIQREYLAPRSALEQILYNFWKAEIKKEDISIRDNFFELGGNSLMAVSLINKINKELKASLELQVLFESSTIEKLADKISNGNEKKFSRLVALQENGSKSPIYCWPGLGGYCMNLRLLAETIKTDKPFYGFQAYGINENEIPYSSLKRMAEEDIKLIKETQPVGPYTLWGYSFGARVAFEAAYQLEQAGETVENLILIAPGSPKIRLNGKFNNNGRATYDNKTYVAILFSVFMGNIIHGSLEECLQQSDDEESFIKYITSKNKGLTSELAKRITNIVSKTYELKYSLEELKEKQLKAPITIFKAKGDELSFIEEHEAYLAPKCETIKLDVDHYSILKNPGIKQLVEHIKLKEECNMPHINIKHFPSLSEEQQAELTTALTQLVTKIMQCDEGAVSIALEPIEKEFWNERVYIPEIVNRKDLLCKSPNY